MSKGPERLELTDPGAYQDLMKARVGDRDPVEILADTADALASIVREHPKDRFPHRPVEGKWSPNEILGHLVDTEWVFGNRLRSILCDDRPRIAGIDQDLWVERQRHRDADPEDLLEAFTVLRALNLALWRRVAEADLERIGRHDERGEETLGLLRLMNTGHDLHHLDQLRDVLAATRKGSTT